MKHACRRRAPVRRDAGGRRRELTLIDAVKAGNRDAVRALLKTPAGEERRSTWPKPTARRALHWAVRADDVEIARAARRRGRQRERREPLRPDAAVARGRQRQRRDGRAAARGRRRREGHDPPGRDGPDGRGADRQPRGRQAAARATAPTSNAREQTLGETALMWAAAENHPEVVKLLVARGADVNARSSNLELGEGSVRPRRRADDPAARALDGADVRGASGLARRRAGTGRRRRRRSTCVDPDGTTALVVAIINGHYDVAAMLVEKAPIRTSPTPRGWRRSMRPST